MGAYRCSQCEKYLSSHETGCYNPPGQPIDLVCEDCFYDHYTCECGAEGVKVYGKEGCRYCEKCVKTRNEEVMFGLYLSSLHFLQD